jgi:hypothetical protein
MNIILLREGKMHKMHKRNNIPKNSCKGTHKVATLGRKKE